MTFLSTLLYVLLINAVPLVAVIWTGGSPAILVLLYWFETAALLVTGTIRIVLHRRATQKAGHYAPMKVSSDHKAGAEDARRALASENTYLHGFLGITVVFTIAHGVFVALLVFLFKAAGPVSWEEARLALYYVVAVQGMFLLWDMPRIAGWSFADLQRNVGSTSIRVLVTQLGIIFGIMVAGALGPWGLAGTFVALRALTDAGISWMQGFIKQKDLPPGLKSFLAKKSKKTAEEIEAEFDQLKADGAEVEKLLELPIAEARRGRRA